MAKTRSETVQQSRARNYDRVEILFPKGKAQEIEEAARKAGYTDTRGVVAAYTRDATNQRLEREQSGRHFIGLPAQVWSRIEKAAKERGQDASAYIGGVIAEALERDGQK